MSFYERAKELVETSSNIKAKVNQTLAKEFNLRSDEVSRMFKSFFGMTVREALERKHLPSREQIEKALILSSDVHEMLALLNLDKTSSYWKGLLDREFGFSTYASAKANYLSKQVVEAYHPTKDDNLAIIVSQFLGDGSFDRLRRSIVIAHGIKQADYLLFKAGLIRKAYPNAYPVSHVRRYTHTYGHEYVSYYTGNFSETTFHKVVNMSKKELIEALTPFGWFLWYLDDGHYSVSEEYGSQSLGIAIHCPELRKLALLKLKAYGFSFNEQPEMIQLQGKAEIAAYINGMLKPFAHLVPACMMYKLEMKI